MKSRRQVRSAGCDRDRGGGRGIKKQKLPAGIPILQWTALSTRPTSFSWTSVTKADACAKNGNFIVEAVCPEPEGDPVSLSGCTPRSGAGPIGSRFCTRVVSSCSARILRSSKIVRRRASKPGSGSPVRGRFGRQKPSSFVASRNSYGGSQGSSCTNVRYSALPAQVVDATQALNRSAGVANRRVLRGRSLAAELSWACEYTDRSVPFGKYCRSRPLVFSLEPRCHGLCGSQK